MVTASAQDALSKGYAVLWRTPESNATAVALAKSMGFEAYASTYDIQLVEDEF